MIETSDNLNIVQFFESFETKNNYYIVMEYCNAGDMSEYVK